MEDIPQPSDTPYEPGDRVRVYTAPDDPDSNHHNTVCEVVDVFNDDLDRDTGRDLDLFHAPHKSIRARSESHCLSDSCTVGEVD